MPDEHPTSKTHGGQHRSPVSRLLRLVGWLALLIAFPAFAHQVVNGLSNAGLPPKTSSGNLVPARHPVTINPVAPPTGAKTELTDHHGQAVTVACHTCHSVRPSNAENRQASDLNEFHQGLKLQHGQLACVACHNADEGYASLHLADGKSVAWEDTMTLCAQCHGTQFRDYQHGSHGGMTGYWDLTRGPRHRNHCINCHDPHAPQYPIVKPTEKPRDRFPPASKDVSHE
jgi:hypothetical protein